VSILSEGLFRLNGMELQMKKLLILIFLLILSTPFIVQADTIIFKDGKKVQTKKAWTEGNQVKCYLDGIIFGYPKNDIKEIIIDSKDSNDLSNPKAQSKDVPVIDLDKSTRSRKPTALKDVDMMTLLTRFDSNNGILIVDPVYENKATGDFVYWDDDQSEVKCQCGIYNKVMTLYNDRKGEINYLQFKKTLHKRNENMIVDIPNSIRGQDRLLMLECFIDTGYKKFTINKTILVH
jgi:hypothetical protein